MVISTLLVLSCHPLTRSRHGPRGAISPGIFSFNLHPFHLLAIMPAPWNALPRLVPRPTIEVRVSFPGESLVFDNTLMLTRNGLFLSTGKGAIGGPILTHTPPP